jgi:hypothetical protein
MRTFRNVIGLFIGLSVLAAIASAVTAMLLKRNVPSRGAEEDDEVALVTIYTGQDFISKSQSFRGGSILTWYGGGSIDLRGATLDPAGATLVARTIFGGFRLVVPETWRVDQRVTAIFGGVGDARDPDKVLPDGPTLVLEGLALFGGIGIVSEAPDLDRAPGTVFETAPDMVETPEVPAPAPA